MLAHHCRRPIRTAEQAASFLHSLIRPDFRPYAQRAPYALESVARLLERAGHPHRGLPVIHIAGSKGKGSTALAAEAVLEATGHSTGTFTSPHLQRWTERFRVGGREITGAHLAETLEALRPHVEVLCAEHPENPPSFFDVLTAAALLLFRASRVDCAIMEVGIGGRYDATNIVEPAVTCVTGIELEHVDKLGNDLASIARHKGGIIKPAVPVIAAPLPSPAAEQISACAAAQRAPLLRLGREIGFEMLA
ncbi:MAG: bifunctional folylpolyglutamate synthase/dihydrofolate synthase, partial [Gammaproteobacteria bacterium]|nr:bifunctional folylpolyglutamate synthase/dihydrofolate synthase [Gammaproteobacteria bacterium]